MLVSREQRTVLKLLLVWRGEGLPGQTPDRGDRCEGGCVASTRKTRQTRGPRIRADCTRGQALGLPEGVGHGPCSGSCELRPRSPNSGIEVLLGERPVSPHVQSLLLTTGLNAGCPCREPRRRLTSVAGHSGAQGARESGDP